jgi:arginyl-tRNA--protein-N-Asp/Glu arginylyltransferase
MWFVRLIMILSVVKYISCDDNILEIGIREIVKEFYAKKSSLNIIVDGDDRNVLSLVDNVVKSCENISVQIESYQMLTKYENFHRRNVIVIAKHFHEFENFSNNLLIGKHFAFDGYFTNRNSSITLI